MFKVVFKLACLFGISPYIDSVTPQGFSLLCPLHLSGDFWPHGFDVSLQTSTQAAALSESGIRPLN